MQWKCNPNESFEHTGTADEAIQCVAESFPNEENVTGCDVKKRKMNNQKNIDCYSSHLLQ